MAVKQPARRSASCSSCRFSARSVSGIGQCPVLSDAALQLMECHTGFEKLLLLQELLAGGVAGALSKTSIAPFERVKILFQVCPGVSCSQGCRFRYLLTECMLQTGQAQGRGVGRMLWDILQTEGPAGMFRCADA